MKGYDIIPHGTSFPFMGSRWIWAGASSLAAIASILLLFVFGLNFGIDFKGGSLLEVQSKQGGIDIASMRATLGKLALGDVQIQKVTDIAGQSSCSNDACAMIRIGLQEGGDQAQQAALEKVRVALSESVTYRNTEVVGPTVQGELIERGVTALLSAILAILAYVWFRFEWQFAVGAVVALVHDVTLTLGLFSLLQMSFDLTIIAALLTIVGYSINDTVVVFDRIRENLRKYKKMALAELLDRSINETLSRTIMTSTTTLIALLGLYFFGGEVIRGFSFAMIWGIVIGTYSSIFIASPIVLALGVTRDGEGSMAGGGNAGLAMRGKSA